MLDFCERKSKCKVTLVSAKVKP